MKILTLLLISVSTLCILITQPVSAQDNESRTQLIFDPIPIKVTTLAANQQIQIIELRTLPSSPPATPDQIDATQQTPLVAPDTFDATVKRYQQAIQALEFEGGPYQAELGQQLYALGSLHQQQGNSGEALNFFEQALHINRLNNGLFNLSQMPIIEDIIQTHLRQGDMTAADERQEYLLYLQRKSYGDSTGFITALKTYADWNIMTFTLPFNIRPVFTFAFEPTQYPSASTINNSRRLQSSLVMRLVNAQNSYYAIGQILEDSDGPQAVELIEIEQRLALTNYLFSYYYDSIFSSGYKSLYQREPFNDPFDYSPDLERQPPEVIRAMRYGREAMNRRLERVKANFADSSPEVITASLELADWLALDGKRAAAKEFYIEAQRLHLANTASTTVESSNSELPVLIPTFLASPFSREANNIDADLALNYRGYFDVAFPVNRSSATGAIRIIGESSTNDSIKSVLINHLREAQFRPALLNGELVNSAYSIRYYYSY